MNENLLQLQQQKNLAEMLNDASIDQVLAFNTCFEIIAWNKACEAETGLRRQDVAGKAILEVFPLLQADREMMSAIDMALRGFKSFIPSDKIRYRPGYFEHHIVPLRENDGAVSSVMIIIHNVAHRVKAENQLRRTNKWLAHFKRITDTCHDAVVSFDTAGKVIYWNPAAERLYGFTAEEMQDQPFTAAIVPAHRMAEFTQHITRAQQGENIIDVITEQISRDGNMIDVLVNIFPIREENYIITGCCIIAKDITEQVKAINNIRSLNQELLTKNYQLLTLNSEFKAFTDVAIHNYNEPLRNLYISLEKIVTNDAANLSNSGRASLRRSQSAIQKMKLLTEDIIAFANLRDLEFHKGLLNINEILDGLLQDFNDKLEKLSITVDREQLPAINGYRFLVSLLFRHLLDNAVKFHSQDRPAIIRVLYRQGVETPAQNDAAAGNVTYDIITVQDNGIGFAPEEKDSIFHLFTTLHEGKYRGSGVGLAICKKIMDMHDGFITAEGDTGKGAAFSCYFPASAMDNLQPPS